MSLPRPTLELVVDGDAHDAASGGVVRVECELASGMWHAGVEVTLAPQSPLVAAEPGASASISLGFDGDNELVFTGYVDELVSLPDGVRLRLRTDSSKLAVQSAAQSYIAQSIADIASDLIDKGGATAGDVDASLKLSIFYADLQSSIWQHLMRLSQLDDLRLGVNADGEIELQKWVLPGPALELRYGAEVLLWELSHRAVSDPPTAVLLGAGSALDSEKWHIFVNAPGEAFGKGPNTAVLARDEDALEAYNSAIAARNDRTAVQGSILIRGEATLRPGMTVSLKDVPDRDDLDLVVNRVLHSFGPTTGFVTALSVERSGGGGPL